MTCPGHIVGAGEYADVPINGYLESSVISRVMFTDDKVDVMHLSLSSDGLTLRVTKKLNYAVDFGSCSSATKPATKPESDKERKEKQEAAKAQQAAIAAYIASSPELQAQIAQAMAANPFAGEAALAAIIYGALADQAQVAYADYMASYQNMYAEMMANYEQMMLAWQNGMVIPTVPTAE